jgi:polar amino acid transport system permease protein
MSILDFSDVLAAWPLFLEGLWFTVFLTVVSCTLGTVLGIACAGARVHGGPVLRGAVACYVEFFRNTPFLAQIFFIFFGLPSIGLRLDSTSAALLSLVLNLGAYACEIVRAGIDATPRGQIEAAESLALDRWQIFTRIVVPPALARIWPGLTSQLVIMMLASALCSQISAAELSYTANFLASKTFRSFESYIVVTLAYLLLAIGLRALLAWLGPRFIFGQLPAGARK